MSDSVKGVVAVLGLGLLLSTVAIDGTSTISRTLAAAWDDLPTGPYTESIDGVA